VKRLNIGKRKEYGAMQYAGMLQTVAVISMGAEQPKGES